VTRDHFGLDAEDYDAPSREEQAEFFAARDDYDRGSHWEQPIQSTPDVWARPAAA
jgi:hypothetical protein